MYVHTKQQIKQVRTNMPNDQRQTVQRVHKFLATFHSSAFSGADIAFIAYDTGFVLEKLTADDVHHLTDALGQWLEANQVPSDFCQEVNG